MVWDPDAPIAAMYPRLPEETAQELAGRLRPGAAAVGEYPLNSKIPTALIFASGDRFFTPEWERFVGRGSSESSQSRCGPGTFR
jgi:hypothetical protein